MGEEAALGPEVQCLWRMRMGGVVVREYAKDEGRDKIMLGLLRHAKVCVPCILRAMGTFCTVLRRAIK